MSTLKTIKCKFKDIFKETVNYEKLFECINKTNQFTFNAYNFIRFYYLSKFSENEEVERLDRDFIRRIYKCLMKKSCGPKNKNSLEDINKYFEIFSGISGIEKMSGINLSYILNDEYTKMEVSYKNNIINNFLKYLFQYINEICHLPSARKISKDEYKKLPSNEKIKYIEENKKISKERKEMLKVLIDVKMDIIENTTNSPKEFNKLIIKIRNILPERICDSLIDDIKNEPMKYLKSMYTMNKHLESNNLKLFQVFPIRTGYSMKYVNFDTSSIKDIFGEVHSDLTHDEIWNKYFNIDFQKFKLKGYRFNEQIQTDGFSVSIIFRETSNFDRKTELHKKMVIASKKGKEKLKKMTETEKDNVNKEKDKNKMEKNKKISSNRKKMKENYKTLSNEEKEKINRELRLNNSEFKYFEDMILDDKFRERMEEMNKKNKIVVGDPGNRTPITLFNSIKRYNYNNRRRNKELKRGKYIRLIRNKTKSIFETKKEIKKYFDKLKNISTKTNDLSIFEKYIKTKYKLLKNIGNKMMDEYNKYLMKMRWYAYINKQRHEDNILNEIEETYGGDATFVIGDWSDNYKIKGLSAPNMRIKRLLEKRFEVYTLDEYNSSKLDHFDHKEMEHATMEINRDGNIISKEIYSVFMFKTKNNTRGYINRDYNATMNMKYIVDTLIRTKERPLEFTNAYKKLVTEHPKRCFE